MKSKILKVTTLILFLSSMGIVILYESGLISFNEQKLETDNSQKELTSTEKTSSESQIVNDSVIEESIERIETLNKTSTSNKHKESSVEEFRYLSSSKYILPMHDMSPILANSELSNLDPNKNKADSFGIDEAKLSPETEDFSYFNTFGSSKSLRGFNPLETNKRKRNLLFYFLTRKKKQLENDLDSLR